MDSYVRDLLSDIVRSIDEIHEFSNGLTVDDFKLYLSNKMMRRAIERDLIIIGEAMHDIVKVDHTRVMRIKNSRRVIELRNDVVHSYDDLANEKIWNFIWKELPYLRKLRIYLTCTINLNEVQISLGKRS
jgi:uncharacterized protein with HEPN domain